LLTKPPCQDGVRDLARCVACMNQETPARSHR
jgi:hypothetical protein